MDLRVEINEETLQDIINIEINEVQFIEFLIKNQRNSANRKTNQKWRTNTEQRKK